MSSPSSESPSEPTHRPLLARLIQSIFSSADDNNVMMAAIVSLVVVILFVFILHLYARSSFRSSRHNRRRPRRRSASARRFPPPSPPPPSFVLDLASKGGGLDPAAIAAIPLFVFEAAAGSELEDDDGAAAECAICLSEFDGGEVGRRLPKCGHEFHVECVDMWLGSHSTCPICRAPVVPAATPAVPGDSDPVDAAAVGVDRRSSSVIDNGDGFVTIEIVTAVDNAENISTGSDCSSSSSSSSSSSFGCSLKRMLSRNRSERKVFPAASVVNGTTDQ